MPLEPKPERTGRRLDREPGTSRFIPLLLTLTAISGLVGFLGFCAVSSQLRSTAVPQDPIERGFEATEARLNATSALEDARRAQENHLASEGGYTSDWRIITATGQYEGVSIEVMEANARHYCMEASGGVPERFWYLSSDMKRPKAGRCP